MPAPRRRGECRAYYELFRNIGHRLLFPLSPIFSTREPRRLPSAVAVIHRRKSAPLISRRLSNASPPRCTTLALKAAELITLGLYSAIGTSSFSAASFSSSSNKQLASLTPRCQAFHRTAGNSCGIHPSRHRNPSESIPSPRIFAAWLAASFSCTFTARELKVTVLHPP